MLLWLNNERKIIAYNYMINEQDAKDYLINEQVVWIPDLKIEIPQIKECELIEMYLNSDNTVNYVIKQRTAEPLTSTDRALYDLQANTEYIACLLENK